MDWKIEENGFHKDNITSNGNKYLIGNGYMGIRGTLEEFKKEYFPAINLAGIYDQVGDGWREPLNAPNSLYTFITIDNKVYRLPEVEPVCHQISLNYRHGVLERRTIWESDKGQIIIHSRRFVSMKDKHVIAMDYSVQTNYDCEVKISTGIDADVWDINGPHYDSLCFAIEEKMGYSNLLTVQATTHENKDNVYVAEEISCNMEYKEEEIEDKQQYIREISFFAKANQEYHLSKFISIFTSKDSSNSMEQAIKSAKAAKRTGFVGLLEEHCTEWEKIWNISAITIEGDSLAMEALNYSMYHLHSIAPRHSDSLSIAARGLSGQTYKGAVFWDTEMFMLDFFLFTEPEVAKTLLKYRIDTLEGAKKKAVYYGYEGAFYAWESQEGGYDACSDYNVTDVFTKRPMRTFFKDKQIHISSAIVYGIMSYLNYTKDSSILAEGGAKTIIECALFYYSLLYKKVSKDQYELLDVIGPDEYHERVNNNAYTNRMAKLTFKAALDILKELSKLPKETEEEITDLYNVKKLIEQFEDASKKIYIPSPNQETGVIEQFDGYFNLEDTSIEQVRSRLLHEKEYWGGAYGVASHTKVIKQADVVTMLTLFDKEYSLEVMKQNLSYYEPRTEHGSSLSACMYALLFCKCTQPDKAYPFFMKSALADWSGEGKEWAGLVYIGGTHPAAAGGAYMTAVKGFGGFYIEDGKVKADPKLPQGWKRLIYRVIYQGEVYEINATKDKVSITQLINKE